MPPLSSSNNGNMIMIPAQVRTNTSLYTGNGGRGIVIAVPTPEMTGGNQQDA